MLASQSAPTTPLASDLQTYMSLKGSSSIPFLKKGRPSRTFADGLDKVQEFYTRITELAIDQLDKNASFQFTVETELLLDNQIFDKKKKQVEQGQFVRALNAYFQEDRGIVLGQKGFSISFEVDPKLAKERPYYSCGLVITVKRLTQKGN